MADMSDIEDAARAGRYPRARTTGAVFRLNSGFYSDRPFGGGID
jgi:hypothetical protein